MDALSSDLFPIPDPAAWRTQVQKELKDENAYESLRWHTDEGFILEPYYTASDLSHLPLAVIQEAQKQIPGWLNTPECEVYDAKEANGHLRDWLTHGADAFIIRFGQQPTIATLLQGIKLSETPVFFRIHPETDTVRFVRDLKTIAPYQLKGGLLNAPDDTIAELTRSTLDSPQFRTICAASHAFHNAGATNTQELAYTLASLTDAYDQLSSEGLTIDQLVPKTMLSISVGTSYFLEIAKLRAFRVLYNRFLGYYSIATTSPLFIHCQTSTFYDATVTPYTNLLRATTEAMAAVIGGCDALTVHPYDAILDTALSNQELSERIARNVSLLLKEESYLDKVADPTAGSYYIETLTHQLVEAAWSSFLDVEKRGGLKKATADGFIQAELERSYQTKVEAVRQGKVLVGVNKFRSEHQPNKPNSSFSDFLGLNSSLPNRRLADNFMGGAVIAAILTLTI